MNSVGAVPVCLLRCVVRHHVIHSKISIHPDRVTWTTQRPRGAAFHPIAGAKQTAAREVDLWVSRLTNNDQVAMADTIRWMLKKDAHIAAGDRTMLDFIFRHRGEPHDPPNTTAHPNH